MLAALCALLFAPPAQPEENSRLAKPPSGKALVFVLRSEREPVPARIPVLVNLVSVGELANGTFLTATVSPGRTHVRLGDRALTVVTLRTAANQSYFVWAEAVPGVRPVRTHARVVSETEGRRLLAQSRFVGSAPPAVAGAAPSRPPATKPAPAPRPRPSRQAAPPAAAAVRRVPPAAEPVRTSEFALIAKGGAFKMANGSQVVAGLASSYDTTSSTVYGLEAEWRSRAGLAVGGEVFHYRNELIASGIPSGEQEVLAFTLNGKYYFRAANWLYPYLGAGVGYANAAFSNGFTGKTSGPAYQALAGAEFRFNHVGLHLQYKYLTSTTGNPGKEVKVGGRGILAGVSIAF
jgi:opacity protein-like surface antigen